MCKYLSFKKRDITVSPLVSISTFCSNDLS